MVPLVVLIASFVLLSALSHLGIPSSYGWWTSLRLALAGMFVLTASAHWGRRRPDLVRMVPPALPRPELLVTATGILEIVGAVGLAIPMLARYAALGLTLLLVAVFPANVRAARHGLAIAGRPALRLLPRTLVQVNTVVSFYDPDLLLFDLPPPLAYRGVDAHRRSLQDWFSTFEEGIGFEVRDLEITAGESVAFGHSFNRITGRRTSGEQTDVWVRATTCWRKLGGRWRIAHEHVSVPFHMDGSEKAALDLEP